MFSVVLVFVLCVFLRGGAASSCEAGWRKDPDSNTCLKFFPAKQTWNNARNSCLRQNSILVAVHSHNSNDFITKNITGGIRTWIGLHVQNSTRDDWRWSSVASPVEYLNWADGEPNNHLSLIYGSEECVEIEDSSGEWNDENCDSLRPYVCQKSLGCPSTQVEGYSDNTTLASTGDQLSTKAHCMTGYRADKRTVNATCQADSKWAIDKFHCSGNKKYNLCTGHVSSSNYKVLWSECIGIEIGTEGKGEEKTISESKRGRTDNIENREREDRERTENRETKITEKGVMLRA
eukprot:sb/3467618/